MSLCAARKLAKLTLVWLLAAVLPLAGVLGAALEVSAELGGRYESNVSNSNLASDRLADGFFTAHLNAGTSGVWGRDWRWHAYLAGEGEQAFRFTGLSQIEGGVRLGVDRKFGLGWNAPRLQIDFYTAYRGFRTGRRLRCEAFSFARRCLASGGAWWSKYPLPSAVVLRRRRSILFRSTGRSSGGLVRCVSHDTFILGLLGSVWRCGVLCDATTPRPRGDRRGEGADRRFRCRAHGLSL